MATSRHDTGRGATRAAERAARDDAIRQARADGAELDELAARHGISRRQVQRIVAGARTPTARPPFSAVSADPIAELEALLNVHTDVLAELEALARGTRHDGVKLGALRARADLATQRFAIFRNVRQLRSEADARHLLDRFLDLMIRRGGEFPAGLHDDLSAIVEEFEPIRAATQPKEAASA